MTFTEEELFDIISNGIPGAGGRKFSELSEDERQILQSWRDGINAKIKEKEDGQDPS